MNQKMLDLIDTKIKFLDEIINKVYTVGNDSGA